MPKRNKPRDGSLQFWPRKRARKVLPRVNWSSLSSSSPGCRLLGFIGYKVGMKSALVKDLTNDSLTKGNRIIIPVTVIEAPHLKILSVRFYKDNKVMCEFLNPNLDRELKRKLKLPKTKTDIKKLEEIKGYEDIRVIVYSLVKSTGIKKTPDIAEIGLSGTIEEKKEFIKKNLNREISVSEIFETGQLVDIRGLTKGKGIQGPVKRFGISLRSHKSEKGRRKPGSIGPWHPAHTTFRVPMAGQLGMFSRVCYNKKVILIKKISERDINPKGGFKHYGEIKTDYLIVHGSVQGPAKRQILITSPLRATKKQIKKNYEFIELR